MVPIFAATLAGVVLTAVATTSGMLLAGAALLGLGYGTMVPAGQTVTLNLVGSARAGIGISSYFLLVDAGTGIGPFVIGALVGPFGHRVALLAGAGCAAVGLVGMVLMRRRIAHKPSSDTRLHQCLC